MIRYTFTLGSGQVFQFKVDRKRIYTLDMDRASHPSWTQLEFNRCECCPLTSEYCLRCPVAVDLEQIAAQFSDIISFEKAQVEVHTPERTYTKDCDVQTGLRSLLGLVMATSACPILSQLKGLADSHLPFATLEETLFRTSGAYLIKQYLIYKGGSEPDWNMRGLDYFYKNLQTVNRGFKSRLDSAFSNEKEAHLNAIGSLLYVSMGVTYSLEDNLSELKSVFDITFPFSQPVAAATNPTSA